MPEPQRPGDEAWPAHPDRLDAAEPHPDGSRWAGIVVVTLIGALVVLILVLHLTGVVGPGAH
jgi:hypothetical protein